MWSFLFSEAKSHNTSASLFKTKPTVFSRRAGESNKSPLPAALFPFRVQECLAKHPFFVSLYLFVDVCLFYDQLAHSIAYAFNFVNSILYLTPGKECLPG